jgi:hypothetical protein
MELSGHLRANDHFDTDKRALTRWIAGRMIPKASLSTLVLSCPWCESDISHPARRQLLSWPVCICVLTGLCLCLTGLCMCTDWPVHVSDLSVHVYWPACACVWPACANGRKDGRAVSTVWITTLRTFRALFAAWRPVTVTNTTSTGCFVVACCQTTFRSPLECSLSKSISSHAWRRISHHDYFGLRFCSRPPLWCSGHNSWLQTQRSRIRFPALLDFLSSSGSITGSTQPHEDKWGAI